MRDDVDAGRLEAERGYAVRGELTWRIGEWLSLRGPDGGPREFERLVRRLYSRRWSAANPERRRELRRRYARKPENKERQRELEKRRRRRRWQERAELGCACCGVRFCPVSPMHGRTRAYCSRRCRDRARYLSAHPGARSYRERQTRP